MNHDLFENINALREERQQCERRIAEIDVVLDRARRALGLPSVPAKTAHIQPSRNRVGERAHAQAVLDALAEREPLTQKELEQATGLTAALFLGVFRVLHESGAVMRMAYLVPGLKGRAPWWYARSGEAFAAHRRNGTADKEVEPANVPAG